jgi:hypothetical protein
VASYNQTPAELSITMIPGDELNVGMNFTAPSGNTTTPLNLAGYTFDARVFVPTFANPDGGFGSGSYTVGTTAANLTVSPVNLAVGQLSLGLNESQTANLSPATSYRWYLRWSDSANLTLTVLSGDFVARLP